MVKKAPKQTQFGGPARPKLGYFLFLDTVREKIMADVKSEAEAAGGKFDLSQIGRRGAAQWGQLSDADKKTYNDKYAAEKKEFDVKQALWEQSDKGKEFKAEKALFNKDKKNGDAKKELFEAGYPKKPGYSTLGGLRRYVGLEPNKTN